MVLKLIGPIFWGLSLVTACSIVMYYVFGKDEEEEENKKVKTSRINVIEVSVPKSIVPALIGRGGSNIKEIEKTTGAKVNVKEFTDKDHDVCVIRGRSDATQIAETLIHDFINQQPLNVEDSIDVPAWACGRIIGTQGENITSISHRSGAKIKILSHNDKTTERKVMFLGTREQIKIAKDLIDNCVAQEKCRREIEQTKRSPRHFQPPSKSPSPTPSVTTSDNTEDAGDSQVHKHVKYKRPVPENDAAIATSHSTCQRHPLLVRDTESGSERVQQSQVEEYSLRRVYSLVINIFIRTRSVYCYIKYRLLVWRKSVKQVAIQSEEESTTETPEVLPWPTPRVPKQPRTNCYRADRGEVIAPKLRVPASVSDHIENALVEYLGIETATKQVYQTQCQDILHAYRWNKDKLLNELLDEAEGALYNNSTHQIIKGEMSGPYMVAYNETRGFVPKNEEKSLRSGKITFDATKGDPIVVTAKCTKIMLHDKILNMGQDLREAKKSFRGQLFPVPKIKWVNGVPGCGKTTWVVRHFDERHDIIATTTIEAAKDMKEKLARRLGDRVKNRVRTLASILVNGFKENYYRLMVDEALMNHFGAIIMAGRLAGAREIVLIGDVNQLPFIDRENLFRLWYTRPNLVTDISQELLCTYRNPMDVAYALSDVYPGIYSSKQLVHSLKVKRFTTEQIPTESEKTLFLVHTQKEKSFLASQGYGSGAGSCILTIHEAQGLTYESVVIINTRWRRLQIHDSVPHAIVAVSRHTVSCVYYTDDFDDAIACFIRRVMDAPTVTIVDYNLKMALKHRDQAVVNSLLNLSKSLTGRRNNSIKQKFLNFVSFTLDRVFMYCLPYFEQEE